MSDDQMLQDRKATYSGFVRLITISTVAVVVALIFMAIFIA